MFQAKKRLTKELNKIPQISTLMLISTRICRNRCISRQKIASRKVSATPRCAGIRGAATAAAAIASDWQWQRRIRRRFRRDHTSGAVDDGSYDAYDRW